MLRLAWPANAHGAPGDAARLLQREILADLVPRSALWP
jgi:hypothetical protein